MTSSEIPIIPEDSSRVKRWRYTRWLIRFVWAYFIFVVIILSTAFFLLLFNANTDVGFVEWVYRSSDRAMEPFRGIFPTATAGKGSIIDFSILFAVIVYGIIAQLTDGLINFIDRKIAEQRSKTLYVAQEAQRRQQIAALADSHQAEIEHEAAREAAAAQLAVEQAAAQRRTADAAERLTADQRTPPPD